VSGDYRVQLDVFSGPLDLLLYLIKQEEIDPTDIPVSRILDQYMKHLEILEAIDFEGIGDFLVMAATLMLIKSRMLLPQHPETDAEEIDPRTDLVQQLIAYKQFKDLTEALARAKDETEKRFPRQFFDPEDEEEKVLLQDGNPLEDISLWDLLDTFVKVMSEVRVVTPTEIVVDDTPLEEHMDNVVRIVAERGETRLTEFFGQRSDKGYLIGVFLALLELCRQRRIRLRVGAREGEALVPAPAASSN
jgi:segregation and condensation protein A